MTDKIDKTIDIAYNTKTGAYGTLIGPAPGPHVIPFRSMNRAQRETMLKRFYPMTPHQLGFVRFRPDAVCSNFIKFYEDVLNGHTPFNPYTFDDLLIAVKVIYEEWRRNQPDPQPEKWV